MELVFGNEGVEIIHENGNWALTKGTGFSPVETLVASVGSCGLYVFQGLLSGSKIDHEFVNAKVAFTTDDTKRVKPVKEITIDYFLKANDADKARIERIVELVPNNCPVMQSIGDHVTVVENVHYV